MKSYDTVILGAGLAGLSFAYHFDKNAPVFEKSLKVGGLVQTTNINGRMFDHAPHLFHVRSEFVKNLIVNELGISLNKHVRKAKIFFENSLINYPFELNLYAVGEKVRRKCLNGLDMINRSERSNEESIKLKSYKDYAIKAFGRGIADYYLLPYNRKVWDTDPGDLTCEWMKFLPTANVNEILKCSKQFCDYKFGYNFEFFYPKSNGIQEISNSFARELSSINFDMEVRKIDTQKKIIWFSGGTRIRYKKIISTLPLRNLVYLTTMEKLKKIAARLSNTCVYNINIVVEGEVPKGVHWIYFPDHNYKFYRISFPKSYFKGCAQKDENILSIEIASRDQNLDDEEFKKLVIEDISTLNIFSIKAVKFIHNIKIPIAYCIYDKDRTEIVSSLKSELNRLAITSIGRYGNWEYSSMEDAILHGRNLAQGMKGQQ